MTPAQAKALTVGTRVYSNEDETVVDGTVTEVGKTAFVVTWDDRVVSTYTISDEWNLLDIHVETSS